MPTYDPRFPDRPQTEDFDKLSSVMRALDALAETPGGIGFDEVMGSVIDVATVAYVAKQRVNIGLLRVRMSGHPTTSLRDGAASWLDGFMAGVEWEKRATDD